MPVSWIEEAPPACDLCTRAPPEDITMAGWVQGHAEYHHDHSADVQPLVCPASDEHTMGTPRCQTRMFDGSRRQCMYLVGLTAPGNSTHRMDTDELREQATTLSARQVRCGIICLRQRANRAPGC